VWPRGNGSAAVLATPTAAAVVGLNREDVEWALQIKQCGIDTELKLPSWTA